MVYQSLAKNGNILLISCQDMTSEVDLHIHRIIFVIVLLSGCLTAHKAIQEVVKLVLHQSLRFKSDDGGHDVVNNF